MAERNNPLPSLHSTENGPYVPTTSRRLNADACHNMTVYSRFGVDNPDEVSRHVPTESKVVTTRKLSLRFIAAAATLTGLYVAIHPTPRDAYEHTYTDPYECLANSPYDPASGAEVKVITGQPDILAVTPGASDAARTILHFVITPHGFFDDVQLSLADQRTAGVLASENCPLPIGS